MKRRVDEFVPAEDKSTEATRLIEMLRENELCEFLDNETCKTSKEANRIINGIVKHYNNLLHAVISGKDIDIILNQLKNEDRRKF